MAPPNPVTDPWRKDCVLTLDGGGVRGYATLWMIKVLMDAIANIEKNDPTAHYTSFAAQSDQIQVLDHELIRENEHTRDSIRLENSRAKSKSWNILRRGTTPRRVSPSSMPSNKSSQSINGNSNEGSFLPCHYFDYISGTSTGGLNAIMLGRLRMSVEECLERYPTMAQNVFTGKKRSVSTRIMQGTTTKYDHRPLEREIKEMVDSRAPTDNPPNLSNYGYKSYPSPPDLCKTLVIANEFAEGEGATVDQPYLFRTYPILGERILADSNQIWEVARATSAADTYFKPIKLNNGNEYSDGGVGNNNPVRETLRDINKIHNTTSFDKAVCVLVSIGAGQKPTKRAKMKNKLPGRAARQISKIINKLVIFSTNTEADHKNILDLADALGFKHYYRWSGGEEVGGLELDDWLPMPKGHKPCTATFIEENVKRYMQQPKIQEEVERCARALVEQRRARLSFHTDRWRRFTHCGVLRCIWCNEFHGSREAVKTHIERIHPGHDNFNLEYAIQGIPETPPGYPGGPL